MAEEVSREIAKLEDKLQKLKAQEVEELRVELKAARKKVRDLEASIAANTGKPVARKRARTSPAKMRSEIFGALAKNPNGLTATEITEKTTSKNYGSVFLFLQRHHSEIKTEGKRRKKRYFLK